MGEKKKKEVVNSDNPDIFQHCSQQVPLAFVRLALVKSSLRLKNILGWSKSKLLQTKRKNGTLWMSKKIGMNKIYL